MPPIKESPTREEVDEPPAAHANQSVHRSPEIPGEEHEDGEEAEEVMMERTFEDGTTITRETYFLCEDRWRHHLTEEEMEIFMPGVPYEEFVAAQQR